jgi:hypothetical protein
VREDLVGDVERLGRRGGKRALLLGATHFHPKLEPHGSSRASAGDPMRELLEPGHPRRRRRPHHVFAFPA